MVNTRTSELGWWCGASKSQFGFALSTSASRRHTVFRRGARTVALGDATSDLLIPLLLGLAPQEADDDHCHVVATNTAGLRVGSEAVVHHVFTDLVKVLLGSNASPDELNDSLRGLAIPDTYA